MHFESSEVRHEYERIRRQLPERPTPVGDFLSPMDVLDAHFTIIDHFAKLGSGFGGVGPREMGLFLSTLDRQHAGFGGQRKYTDSFEIAATLFFGLIKNHPFHDANKRTAVLSLLLHLQRLGRVPTISHSEIEALALSTAENRLPDAKSYKVASRNADDHVIAIGNYLRRQTRKYEREDRLITFRELETILGRHGFGFRNPKGNYIDIVRLAHTRRVRYLLWTREERVEEARVMQIGFPGANVQLNKTAIRRIRKELQLTADNGVDSEAFYSREKPLASLLSQYLPLLVRLANK